MNQWQKILGAIAFGAIGIILILEISAGYMWQDLITSENIMLWNMFTHIVTLECVAVMCYLIAVALFICRWGKEACDEIDR